jgi:parallel beta-helix repeat protein
MRAWTALAVALTSVAFAASAAAETWYVPAECPTIQAGIDSAAVGDTVLVECGTYYEHDIEMKSGIHLASELGEPDCVTVDAQQLGRVLYCSFVDSTSSIVGFTITGGIATGSHPDFCGGGMYALLSSPTVKACRFTANEAKRGGGAYCDYASDMRFSDCEFSANVVDEGHGGGLYTNSASPSLSDCAFESNQAPGFDGHGGGMYCQASSFPTLLRCTFSRNGTEGLAGGMYCGSGSQPELTGCVFTENQAGICGGLFCFSSSPTVTECAFIGNDALYCAGLRCEYYASPLILDCVFEGNTGQYVGAAVECDDYSSPTLSGCTFAGNSLGVIYCFASDATLRNCTLVENDGVAISVHASSHASVENCIVAFNERPVSCSSSSSADLTCTDVYGNELGNWGYDCISAQYGINGNIGEDPLFCGAMSSMSPLALHSNSPCAPEHNPECDLIGAWAVDCGSTAVEPTSWGTIKAMFR